MYSVCWTDKFISLFPLSLRVIRQVKNRYSMVWHAFRGPNLTITQHGEGNNKHNKQCVQVMCAMSIILVTLSKRQVNVRNGLKYIYMFFFVILQPSQYELV